LDAQRNEGGERGRNPATLILNINERTQMQGYTDTILKYAADETHVGLLKNPDGTGEVGLTGQDVGKRLAVRFTLNIASNQVQDIRFQVFGCGFTIAACAAAAELSKGRSLDEIQLYDPKLIDKRLGGLPEDRDYCAELANQALQAAIISARNSGTPTQSNLSTEPEEDHGPRIGSDDRIYRSLLETATPLGIEELDRQMFAGLFATVSQEKGPLTAALGLTEDEISELLKTYFPGYGYSILNQSSADMSTLVTVNLDILNILLAHVPCDSTGGKNQTSEWLARVIASRAAHPGHLWVAMGFFERAQLSAAIRRHLPTLAAANDKGMRWKRYLFKQVCEMNGGMLCKSPNCGDCSDYAICFAPEVAEPK
jgi:nitrogen fixation protein NifQ